MKKGYFGEFGGCFVPELLMPPLLEVEEAMQSILPTERFQTELQDLLRNFAGRPTPLTFCPRLSEELGIELWLKREDLLRYVEAVGHSPIYVDLPDPRETGEA